MIGDRTTFTIGSDARCDLVLADETVAPHHAELEVRIGRPLVLLDCGQAPATQVTRNGQLRPVRLAVLGAADRVRFGDLEMSVSEMVAALEVERRVPGWALLDERSSSAELGGGAEAAPQPSSEGEHRTAPADVLLPCARCHAMTDSLKRHRLARWFVFLGIAWWAQMADYTACAACMRRILVERTLVNLPGANLAWPIIAAINGWHYAASFRRGHGKRVRELLP